MSDQTPHVRFADIPRLIRGQASSTIYDALIAALEAAQIQDAFVAKVSGQAAADSDLTTKLKAALAAFNDTRSLRYVPPPTEGESMVTPSMDTVRVWAQSKIQAINEDAVASGGAALVAEVQNGEIPDTPCGCP